jgi:subfamily B ATP-binding cassette protein MsbA
MRVIRAFGQEVREEQRFAAASERVRTVTLRMDAVSGLVHPLLEVLYAPLFIGIALLAWFIEIGMPILLAFLLLLYRLQPHVKGIDYDRVHLATLSGAVREVFALLDRSNKPYLPSGRSSFATLRDSIEFRGVSFRYGGVKKDETRPALREVSLRIRSGGSPPSSAAQVRASRPSSTSSTASTTPTRESFWLTAAPWPSST